MFSPLVQLVIALVVVAAAVAFLVLRVRRLWRGRSADCGTCPSRDAKPSPVVSIDLAPAEKSRNQKL